jgi:hypothetical protein
MGGLFDRVLDRIHKLFMMKNESCHPENPVILSKRKFEHSSGKRHYVIEVEPLGLL